MGQYVYCCPCIVQEAEATQAQYVKLRRDYETVQNNVASLVSRHSRPPGFVTWALLDLGKSAPAQHGNHTSRHELQCLISMNKQMRVVHHRLQELQPACKTVPSLACCKQLLPIPWHHTAILP
jgi:hypothetical protein